MNGVVHLDSDVLPSLGEAQLARLRRETRGMTWRVCHGEEDFLQHLPDADAALVWQFRPEWWELAPRLRLLSTPAAGRDWIALTDRPGARVLFGTFHGELMAETAIALMYGLARGVKVSADRMGDPATPWPRAEVTAGMRTLRGSRAVILGFGHIGKWISRLLIPLGVKVWGVNRSDLARPAWFGPNDAVRPLTDLDLLLPETGHLIVVLPGGVATNRLIDARRLALLPKSACVYNFGRGNAIDSAALAAALERGDLAGAGLDVFDPEPLPADSPLRRCPNTLLLPHVSAFSPNYLDLYLDELLPHFAL